jgi:hypothetical protein
MKCRYVATAGYKNIKNSAGKGVDETVLVTNIKQNRVQRNQDRAMIY